MRQEFGSFAEEALRLYPATSDAEAQRASWQLEGDRTFVWSSRTAARLQHSHGSAPAWHYWFDRVPPIPASADVIERDYAAAFHTAEVPYIFKNLEVRRWPWTAADHRLAGLISGAWTVIRPYRGSERRGPAGRGHAMTPASRRRWCGTCHPM